MKATSAAATEPILPGALYPLTAFCSASGISSTRIRAARRGGLDLPVRQVGRRKFVRGSDGIKFIERLADHHAAQN